MYRMFLTVWMAATAALGWPVFADPPARIISCAPNISETVFALGEGDRLVGRSSFCDYPPEVQSIPSVGGYFDPNLEKITLLQPDLILLQGKHQMIENLALRNGLKTLHVNMDDLDSIYSGISCIGAALGRDQEAAALNARICSELQAVRDSVATLPRPATLIITTRQKHNLNSLFTVSGASFVSQVVDIAGGRNIYADAGQTYFEASKEQVVMRAPEVIVEFHSYSDLSDDEKAQYRQDWKLLASLPAVRNGRIYLVTENHALRPGPRVAEIARLIAARLHPELESPAP